MKKLNEIEKEKLIAICELYWFKDRILLLEEYDYDRPFRASKYKAIEEKLQSKKEKLTEEDRTSLTIAIDWTLNNIKHDRFMEEFYTRLMENKRVDLKGQSFFWSPSRIIKYYTKRRAIERTKNRAKKFLKNIKKVVDTILKV